jgi:hypothetical protein
MNDEDDFSDWVPRPEYIAAGYFEVVTKQKNGVIVHETRVTQKGLEWLKEKYGEEIQKLRDDDMKQSKDISKLN